MDEEHNNTVYSTGDEKELIMNPGEQY